MRLSGFVDLYQQVKLGDKFKLYRGSSPRPIINYISNNNSDPYWIKIGDMPENGYIVNSIKEHISIEGAKKSRRVYKGDMILSNSMSFGKPYILNVDGFIHDGWFVIRNYERSFDRDYLRYLLASPTVQKRYSQIAAGGVVLNISSDLVNSVIVKIPSLDEQKKISSFLSVLDERIEIQNKIIEKLQSQMKAIYHNIFADCEDDNIVPLRSICTIKKGTQLNGTELFDSGDFYVMNGGITPSGYYNQYNTEENTISISEGGNSCGYVQYNKERFWSGGHCYTLNNLSSNIISKYLYHFLKAHEEEIMRMRIGTGLPNIQKKDLESFDVYVPEIGSQTQILSLLDCVEAKIVVEKELLEKLREQKKYLLSNMFI